jgi:general secretion pathway protein L
MAGGSRALAIATGVPTLRESWSSPGVKRMLAEFLAWWTARIAELLPASLVNAAAAPDGIVIDVDRTEAVTAWLRRKGREEPIGLGLAARLAARKTVVLRPAAAMVLEKRYAVPTAPRNDLDRMLRHDLGRVTPFPARALFWRWDGRPKPGDRTRTDVVLTMVPKTTLAAALEGLAAAGIEPRFLEIDSGGQRKLLPLSEHAATQSRLLPALSWLCCGLAVTALVLPFLLQALTLHATNAEIAALQPSVTQVEALRRSLTAGGAGREVLAREQERTADVLQVLATLTRILPDDSFLTDFALRDRHFTISGRSASAPGLITGLSAEPTIRDASFTAPVTRIEGATADIFSIGADVAP